jgi:hypothetical protein
VSKQGNERKIKKRSRIIESRKSIRIQCTFAKWAKKAKILREEKICVLSQGGNYPVVREGKFKNFLTKIHGIPAEKRPDTHIAS